MVENLCVISGRIIKNEFIQYLRVAATAQLHAVLGLSHHTALYLHETACITPAGRRGECFDGVSDAKTIPVSNFRILALAERLL